MAATCPSNEIIPSPETLFFIGRVCLHAAAVIRIELLNPLLDTRKTLAL
jgi:hypothetical protein